MGGKSGTYAAYADGRVAFLPQDLDFDWYQWMNNYLANK
jgi:hypothetical protein